MGHGAVTCSSSRNFRCLITLVRCWSLMVKLSPRIISGSYLRFRNIRGKLQTRPLSYRLFSGFRYLYLAEKIGITEFIKDFLTPLSESWLVVVSLFEIIFLILSKYGFSSIFYYGNKQRPQHYFPQYYSTGTICVQLQSEVVDNLLAKDFILVYKSE